MPKKKPDMKKAHEALLADPALASDTPKEAVPVLLQLLDELPTVLKDHLEKKVTLASLMDARLAINEHMLESGFFAKLFKAVPASFMPFPVTEMVAMATQQLKDQRTPLMEMIHDTEAFLAERSVTERQLLAHAEMGRLNVASLIAYDKGKLTVLDLVETQPTTLISAGAG